MGEAHGGSLTPNLHIASELLKWDLLHFEFVQFADMIRRRNLRTRSIKLLVLDEADEMLNKGIVMQQVGITF